MKVIQSGLSKQQITGCTRYQQWYRKVGNEILLMIDDSRISTKTGDLVNLVNYKENIAFLCVDDMDYCIDFYNKNRYYIPRLFIKNNKGVLYNEYAVYGWNLSEEGISVVLVA